MADLKKEGGTEGLNQKETMGLISVVEIFKDLIPPALFEDLKKLSLNESYKVLRVFQKYSKELQERNGLLEKLQKGELPPGKVARFNELSELLKIKVAPALAAEIAKAEKRQAELAKKTGATQSANKIKTKPSPLPEESKIKSPLSNIDIDITGEVDKEAILTEAEQTQINKLASSLKELAEQSPILTPEELKKQFRELMTRQIDFLKKVRQERQKE